MAQYKLLELIDQRTLQNLLDAFSKATGMAALATDLDGPVTNLSGPTDFCMNYTRKSREGCSRCNQCDLRGGDEALRTGKPAVYYCHGGLVDFASPIIVNGEHIGSLIGGQVLTEEPDLEKFRRIAGEIGVDPDKYVAAVKKVQIVSKDKVENAANLLFQMANALSSAGLERHNVQLSADTNSALISRLHKQYDEMTEFSDLVADRTQKLSDEFSVIQSKTKEAVKSVENTNSIIKLTQSITTQMTLLGFNASIEAKRVGAAGEGFNVIAQEVRKLAQQTAKQTDDIENVLTQIKDSIKNIETELSGGFTHLAENADTVKELKGLVDQTAELINQIK